MVKAQIYLCITIQTCGTSKCKLEQLERLRSANTLRRPMITHIDWYQIPCQNKTKSKLQNWKICQKLLNKMCKYEIDPASIVEVTERTDGRTDRRTDDMKPVYPPFNFVEARGIINTCKKWVQAKIGTTLMQWLVRVLLCSATLWKLYRTVNFVNDASCSVVLT